MNNAIRIIKPIFYLIYYFVLAIFLIGWILFINYKEPEKKCFEGWYSDRRLAEDMYMDTDLNNARSLAGGDRLYWAKRCITI